MIYDIPSQSIAWEVYDDMIEKIKKRKNSFKHIELPKKIYATCRTKHRYRTEKDAMDGAHRVKDKYGYDVTYYFCDLCHRNPFTINNCIRRFHG